MKRIWNNTRSQKDVQTRIQLLDTNCPTCLVSSYTLRTFFYKFLHPGETQTKTQWNERCNKHLDKNLSTHRCLHTIHKKEIGLWSR